ncbi:MAG: hypothetical protein K2K08_08235, partial [Paramuribaculum sp.]|nr:hypothetical protein [Paramuribaculum sp.]
MNTNIINGQFAPIPDFTHTALLRTPRIILTATNSTITIYSADSPYPVLLSATLPSPPLCALDCGDTVIVMTSTAQRFIVCTQGQWTLIPEETMVPVVSFYAEPQGILQAATVSFASSRGTSLSNGIMPGSALQRKITSALIGAYTSLTDAAREGGLFLQPIVARCLFLDAQGAIVAVTIPQIVGLPDLWQAVSPISTSVTKRSDTDFTISPFVVSATPWKLHLDLSMLSTHPHFSRITSVKVLITAPVDFLDSKARSPLRFSGVHGNSPGCTAAVPGATVALSPAVARLKNEAVRAARSTQGYFIAATLNPNVTGAVIAPPVAPVAVQLNLPARFSASCVTRSG